MLWDCYSIIMDAFEFYSVMGTSLSAAYTIQSNAFNDFVDDCKITDMDKCKRKDIDTIFIVANLEEDKQSKVNKANDDRALMRFEFLECPLRIYICFAGMTITGKSNLIRVQRTTRNFEFDRKMHFPINAQ